MNILLTTHVVPWPVASGAGIRAAETIRALSTLGSVDVVCIVDPARAEARTVPEDAPVERLSVMARPARLDHHRGLTSHAGRLRWLATTQRPLKLARDYAEARDRFVAWSRADYDLAWLGGAEGFTAFSDLIDAPVICNLDDLEDRKLAARMGLGDDRAVRSRRSPTARAWAEARDRVDAARWRRLYRSMAAGSATIAVCSDPEARQLGAAGIANVEVVPNVYAAPACAAGHDEVGTPPTITFVGLLTYEPNIDGARFLVHDVLPRLRGRLGTVQLRLVGSHDDRVADLAHEPGVTLTGAVPDMAPELARADVAAVPIRFGGGTRIKILEAFAHRLPVVATTIGAEGLDVTDGEHVLLADDAEAFAAACARALDPAVRRRLASAGHDLWRRCYQPEAMQRRVVELVTRAVN